ncbi:Rap30/74 interaction domain-containing protein [Hypoxylon sp. FL1150]|nr:Rap30/74 interaction domain-containing protein [Hypoxylon sp. FL1150]
MSARPSSSGGPSSQRPTPPPGAPPLRKRPNAPNPLVPRKKPARRPPPTTLPKGVAPGVAARPGLKPPHPGLARQGQPNPEALRRQNGGWSTPKPDGAQEFPLYVTKKALKEGLRFHVMRFALPSNRVLDQNDPGIDPSNQDDFTRPVTLHRREPRQPPPGREVKKELPVDEENPVDTAEAERIAQLKADREAQRAADNAQKAPVAKDTGPKTKQQKDPKKPGIQVHRAPRTEEQKKQAEIRYEEALPWHLEDADGKNVWVGQYEAPLSDCKIALKIHNGGYRIIPLEKWYKFHSKRGAFNAMTIEEAEKAMNKKVSLGRWAVRDTQRQEAEKAMADSRAIVNGRTAVKQESGTFKSVSRREKMDHDDIDMSGDEFQDDDETAGWEPDHDEDSKQASDRIRRDQLNANLFGDADEVKVEKEEDEEKKEELERKKYGKEVAKALKKRDKQFQYSSDSSDGNPFASEDESDSDSDSEKEGEEKKAEKDKGAGTPSKGANTPQGKKAAAEAAKKGKSLKRAGSPMVSDSSGTESTRKKKKTTHGSRATSPVPSGRRGKPGVGSTPDGEGTAGEMSDGAGGKKNRLSVKPPGAGGSRKGTPAGSRATSPVPPQGGASRSAAAASRAGSPSAPQSPTGNYHPPTPQEITDALPPLPGGITIGVLLKKFSDRIDKPGMMTRKEWLKMVRENSNFNNAEKMLRRKA